MIRNGERIELRDYAHCTETNCQCNCSTESFGPTSLSSGSSAIKLKLHAGYYHDCYENIIKVIQTAFAFARTFPYYGWVLLKCCILCQGSPPNLIIAPNAGVAAYRSWVPTIVSHWNSILRFSLSIWCLVVYTRIEHEINMSAFTFMILQQCIKLARFGVGKYFFLFFPLTFHPGADKGYQSSCIFL